MIYIDPPYNTGKDFVYHDNFRQNVEEYDDSVERIDADGNQNFKKNTRDGGRFHSDWLNMMFPRLKLAKNLLSEDGVIFISIDENEFTNLKIICDEVFGEENFVENFIWAKNSTKNLSKTTSTNHEYVFCYAKNIRDIEEDENIFRIEKEGFNQAFAIVEDAKNNGATPQEAEQSLRNFYSKNPNLKGISAYKFVDEKYRIFTSGDASAPISSGKSKNIFEVVHPKTGRPTKTPSTGWRFGREKFLELMKEERILFGEDENRVPRYKRYLSEQETEVARSMIKDFTDGKKELMRLFDGHAYFENAKPTTLIKQFIKLHNKNALIMDFFAGSATTADAVMQLNAEDGGNRKFIMVQLPEETDEKSEAFKAGYKTIPEISRERIRRAGDKIAAENPNAKLDIGFRALKIDSSNQRDVSKTTEEISQENLLDDAENIKDDRNQFDLLYGFLLASGMELSSKFEIEKVSGKDVLTYDYLGEGTGVVACFEKTNSEIIEKIAHKQPLVAVFRDSMFDTSQEKINLMQQIKAVSPETEVKVV
ncbi:MAG: site-specific DNA-methyltransferase [Candidatus Nanogingivalis sp.]